MYLQLIREHLSENSTEGRLYLNGEFECYTLEDKDRHLEDGENEKVYGKTAIPRGEYEINLTMSNRFQEILPLLKDVKDFNGIRIHPGNTSKDTEGCILVGQTATKDNDDFIGSSRLAFESLMEKLEKAERITIEIV